MGNSSAVSAAEWRKPEPVHGGKVFGTIKAPKKNERFYAFYHLFAHRFLTVTREYKI